MNLILLKLRTIHIKGHLPWTTIGIASMMLMIAYKYLIFMFLFVRLFACFCFAWSKTDVLKIRYVRSCPITQLPSQGTPPPPRCQEKRHTHTRRSALTRYNKDMGNTMWRRHQMKMTLKGMICDWRGTYLRRETGQVVMKR